MGCALCTYIVPDSKKRLFYTFGNHVKWTKSKPTYTASALNSFIGVSRHWNMNSQMHDLMNNQCAITDIFSLWPFHYLTYLMLYATVFLYSTTTLFVWGSMSSQKLCARTLTNLTTHQEQSRLQLHTPTAVTSDSPWYIGGGSFGYCCSCGLILGGGSGGN